MRLSTEDTTHLHFRCTRMANKNRRGSRATLLSFNRTILSYYYHQQREAFHSFKTGIQPLDNDSKHADD